MEVLDGRRSGPRHAVPWSARNPEDAAHDDLRRVYNAMIDKRPALVARRRDVADVIAAVNFGRESGVRSPSVVARTAGPASARWTAGS
jgi:hypothetical protein